MRGPAKGLRAALAVLIAIGLSGCVAVGIVDRTAGVIDQSVGLARNNSILLNIVRASNREPLYFYSVSRVSGAGTADMKISFPAITFGPHRTAAQKNYTFGYNGLSVLDTQQSGSFDIAVLESKNFYEGMLQPLGLDEVDVILHQGFSRELIYRLAVQDVTIYDETGLHRFVNDPASPGYPLFNGVFTAAMTHGITVESYAGASDTSTDADAGNDAGGGGGDRDAKTSATGGAKHKGHGGGGPQVRSRLCFDPALIEDPSALKDSSATGNECGERPPPTEADSDAPTGDLRTTYQACIAETKQAVATIKTDKADKAAGVTPPPIPAPPSAPPAATHNRVCAHIGGKIVAVQLNTRSLFGIYAYLGALLHSHEDVELAGLGASVEPRATGPLLVIREGVPSPCFAKIELGKAYCIPQDGSENIKEVFSLLNSLQALKTAPGDLPITPAVRIEE